jgi:hypothetical protein
MSINRERERKRDLACSKIHKYHLVLVLILVLILVLNSIFSSRNWILIVSLGCIRFRCFLNTDFVSVVILYSRHWHLYFIGTEVRTYRYRIRTGCIREKIYYDVL